MFSFSSIWLKKIQFWLLFCSSVLCVSPKAQSLTLPLRREKQPHTTGSWLNTIPEVLALLEAGLALLSIHSFIEHQARLLWTIMDQDKIKTTWSSCLNMVKNTSIVQTTQMTKQPTCWLLCDCYFFTYYRFVSSLHLDYTH